VILFAAVSSQEKSADGRVLTWKISVQATVKHPLGISIYNFTVIRLFLVSY
jgi:hypothetical protein